MGTSASKLASVSTPKSPPRKFPTTASNPATTSNPPQPSVSKIKEMAMDRKPSFEEEFDQQADSKVLHNFDAIKFHIQSKDLKFPVSSGVGPNVSSSVQKPEILSILAARSRTGPTTPDMAITQHSSTSSAKPEFKVTDLVGLLHHYSSAPSEKTIDELVDHYKTHGLQKDRVQSLVTYLRAPVVLEEAERRVGKWI